MEGVVGKLVTVFEHIKGMDGEEDWNPPEKLWGSCSYNSQFLYMDNPLSHTLSHYIYIDFITPILE